MQKWSLHRRLALTIVARVGTEPRNLILGFMIATAFGSSLSFMLPVGTPPNAIAYGTGYLTTRDMIRAGIALNIIGALLVTLVMFTLIPFVMDIGIVLPPWAQVLR